MKSCVDAGPHAVAQVTTTKRWFYARRRLWFPNVLFLLFSAIFYDFFESRISCCFFLFKKHFWIIDLNFLSYKKFEE
jgi:hypothetical protein